MGIPSQSPKSGRNHPSRQGAKPAHGSLPTSRFRPPSRLAGGSFMKPIVGAADSDRWLHSPDRGGDRDNRRLRVDPGKTSIPRRSAPGPRFPRGGVGRCRPPQVEEDGREGRGSPRLRLESRPNATLYCAPAGGEASVGGVGMTFASFRLSARAPRKNAQTAARAAQSNPPKPRPANPDPAARRTNNTIPAARAQSSSVYAPLSNFMPRTYRLLKYPLIAGSASFARRTRRHSVNPGGHSTERDRWSRRPTSGHAPAPGVRR